MQPAVPSMTSSRCIATSAAAAAAADTASKFLQAGDLQQLQELVQQALQDTTPSSSSSLSAADTAAAYAAATRLAGKQPAAAAPVLQLLAPAWAAALPAASIQDISTALLCWSKLGYSDAQLWGGTLRAVPGLCSAADGQELANVALALATAAEAGKGAVPGVTREEAEEVLRAVTHQLVTMVTAASAEAAAAGAAAAADGGSSGKGVSMSNIATLRWAHEVLESSGSS